MERDQTYMWLSILTTVALIAGIAIGIRVVNTDYVENPPGIMENPFPQ